MDDVLTTVLVFIARIFFFQAEDGIRDADVTGVQTCALPICPARHGPRSAGSGHTRAVVDTGPRGGPADPAHRPHRPGPCGRLLDLLCAAAAPGAAARPRNGADHRSG